MEAIRPLDSFRAELEERTLTPLRRTGKGFYILFFILLAIIGWGVFTYSTQLQNGLLVTGMRDRVSWGLYISVFVFFIGASMAGTFVSAILRITSAGWRTPITRSAEMVTVASLLSAGLFVLFDMGRPDRLGNLFVFARWESPLVWDVYGLNTYLIASLIYLYAALIPDLAYCRDHIGAYVSPARRWFFKTLAIDWQGTGPQRRHLLTALTLMTILVIPVAVMMHTVTSWIFAMTLREPWDSPVFGIYFVAGAIFSGVGIIIILLAVLRKAYRLESFITRKHFLYLGYLLGSLAVIMFFFNVSELVTHSYKLRGDIVHHLEELFEGGMAPMFWTYFWGGLLAPIVIIALPFTRNIAGMVVAAVLVNIGMFLERYIIVVGGMQVPLNPYETPSYSPTWVEWSLLVAGLAMFVLLLMLQLKLVPNMSITEMIEDHEIENADAGVPEKQSHLAEGVQPAGGG